MEFIPLLSVLAGALIGSLSSVATLIIQAHYQARREMKKMAVELGMEDYRFRIQDQSGLTKPASAPILIGYWDKMIDLVNKGRLTPENIREVLMVQADLSRAISEIYWEHDRKGPATG